MDWIKTTDKLPPDREWVLTVSNSKKRVSVCMYDSSYKTWLCQRADGISTIDDGVEVILWIKLPNV